MSLTGIVCGWPTCGVTVTSSLVNVISPAAALSVLLRTTMSMANAECATASTPAAVKNARDEDFIVESIMNRECIAPWEGGSCRAMTGDVRWLRKRLRGSVAFPITSLLARRLRLGFRRKLLLAFRGFLPHVHVIQAADHRAAG